MNLYRIGTGEGAEVTRLGAFPSHLPAMEEEPEADDVWALMRASGETVVYARGDLPELVLFGSDSGSLSVVRQPGESVENGGSVRIGSTGPLYTQLQIDTGGRIWAKRVDSNTWSLFEPSGHWLGDVEMPDGLVVQFIDDEYVVGMKRNSLGVETVVLHRIIRPS